MFADDLHLQHARAYLSLLRRLGEKTAQQNGQFDGGSLEAVLQELDREWGNLQKAQAWCAGRADDLEEAALLCGGFATAAPKLLSLRMSADDWLRWLSLGLEAESRFADEQGRLVILESLGHAYLKDGDHRQAYSHFEEQLAVAERRGDRQATGEALCGLANAASLAGDSQGGLILFKRSMAVAHEIENEQLEADVLGNLAILLDDIGQPEEAYEANCRALEISRRIHDRAGECRHLGNLAGLCKHLGQLDHAAELYRHQLAIVRDHENRRTEARILHNLGLIHLEREELDDSVANFEGALSIRRRVGDRLGEGRDLAALGIVLRKKGDNPSAIAFLNRWLQTARDLDNRLEEAEALTNLGNATKELERSRELYEAALLIVNDLEHRRGQAILLNNLGRIYDLSGDTERAFELIAKGVEAHRQAGNRIGEARSLFHLAKIGFRVGRVVQALAWGYSALDIYHEIRHRNWVLDLIYLIGGWVLETGNDDLRLEYEARVEVILSEYSDAKTDWIRSRSIDSST